MLSHVYLGINNLSSAERFYSPIMACLGWRKRFSDTSAGWAAWQPADAVRPLLIIGKPYDGSPARPGNGVMIALNTKDRAAVDMAFAEAMRAGGKNEGKPRLRPRYHQFYYGAYFRDLDSNKLCVCCHADPADPITEAFAC